ncbi:transmembrane protein 273 isoform X1 [Grus americana]|nr:transmembrane protein 273 isoform X1 [Grus americana]
MTLLTSWISVLMALLLLLHIWRAKVYASGNSEEEIDFTYVIIGATLGAFLAIGFVAVIICMIKKQMIDNVFEGEVTDFVMAAKFNIFNDDLTLTPLMIPHPSLQAFAKR